MKNKEMSLSEKITYSTVLIRCEYSNGTYGCGTGFIINLCVDKNTNAFVPVIVTNNHVVKDSINTVFEFCLADVNGKPNDQEVFAFSYKGNAWIPHPNPQIDLCCLLLAPALDEVKKKGKRIFCFPLSIHMIPNDDEIKDYSSLEEIIMIGYPIGLSDTYNHKPIIRRGITATHMKNDYLGEDHFLIDMACFPGSSGSPIFIFKRETLYSNAGKMLDYESAFLVGILFAGPQYNAKGKIVFSDLTVVPHVLTDIPINLGVAIKARELLQFESIFQKERRANNGTHEI